MSLRLRQRLLDRLRRIEESSLPRLKAAEIRGAAALGGLIVLWILIRLLSG